MQGKRLISYLLIAACVMLLCGCGDEIPDLSPENKELITEYSAALLLKYDSNTPTRLLPEGSVVSVAYVDPAGAGATPEEIIPEQPDPDIAVDNVPDVTSDDVTVTDTTTGETTASHNGGFADFLAGTGLNVDYAGYYEVVDSYPEGEDVNPYFTVDASSGNKLMVLHFILSNTTGEDTEINMNGLNLRYRVSINGGKNKFVMTTLLENDLLSYVGVVGAGQSEDVVAVCEISEEEAAAIQTIDFTIRGDEFSSVLSLQ